MEQLWITPILWTCTAKYNKVNQTSFSAQFIGLMNVKFNHIISATLSVRVESGSPLWESLRAWTRTNKDEWLWIVHLRAQTSLILFFVFTNAPIIFPPRTNGAYPENLIKYQVLFIFRVLTNYLFILVVSFCFRVVRAVFTNFLTTLGTCFGKFSRKYLLQTNFTSTKLSWFYIKCCFCNVWPVNGRYFNGIRGSFLIPFLRKYVVR